MLDPETRSIPVIMCSADWNEMKAKEEWMKQMCLRTGRRAPPPGLRSPLIWGTEEGARALLGAGISSLQTMMRDVVFRFPSPEHMVEFNRTYFGPTKVAFDALDETGQAKLTEELLGVLRKYNRAHDGALVAPAPYLEVIAIRSA